VVDRFRTHQEDLSMFDEGHDRVQRRAMATVDCTKLGFDRHGKTWSQKAVENFL
jgi:hypothetical protein